jgi:succinyl-CoA synthetase beta subunit
MRLFEYEAKRIFQQAGIPVPRSGCARDPKEAAQIAEQIHGPADAG